MKTLTKASAKTLMETNIPIEFGHAGRGAEGHELRARRGAGRRAQEVRRNTQPEAPHEEGERESGIDDIISVLDVALRYNEPNYDDNDAFVSNTFQSVEVKS